MSIEITKEYEGKIVYAIPTGNAARGWNGEPQKFDVIKRKKIYVVLKPAGGSDGHAKSYHPISGATQSEINAGYGGNSGYKFFASLEDIELFDSYCKKLKDVKSYFRDIGRSSLSTQQVNSIHSILFSDS